MKRKLWSAVALAGFWGMSVQAAEPGQVLLSCTPDPAGEGWLCAPWNPTKGEPVSNSEPKIRIEHSFRPAGSNQDPGEGGTLLLSQAELEPEAPAETTNATIDEASEERPAKASPMLPPEEASEEPSPAAKAASALVKQAETASPIRESPAEKAERVERIQKALEQSSLTYTLQLAACIETDCEAERARLGIPEARVFKLREGDKRWSVVLAGRFATVQEAQAVGRQLVEQYNLKQQPWVRSLKTLARLLDQ